MSTEVLESGMCSKCGPGHTDATCPKQETTVEQKETREVPQMKDVTYVHIEDQPQWQLAVEKGLKDQYGMDKKLGSAKSAEQAVALLKELAEAGKKIDMVLLDQRFYEYEDDSTDTEVASEEVIQQFAKMLQDPELQQALADTKILMFSGTVTTDWLEDMRAITDRVVGFVPKDLDLEKIKDGMIKAGIARENES